MRIDYSDHACAHFYIKTAFFRKWVLPTSTCSLNHHTPILKYVVVFGLPSNIMTEKLKQEKLQ